MPRFERKLLDLYGGQRGNVAKLAQSESPLPIKPVDAVPRPKSLLSSGTALTFDGNFDAVKFAIGQTGFDDRGGRSSFSADVEIDFAGRCYW